MSLDGSPAARDFEQSVDARNAAEIASNGSSDIGYTAAELLPGWQESAHELRRLFGARVDARIVARGAYETRKLGDAVTTAWLHVHVHPDFTGRGIGRALADRLEAVAIEEGKDRIHVYAASSPAEGPRIAPTTGVGSLPAHGREVRFLLARGYLLGQIERSSRLALPVDPQLLAERRAIAEAAAQGYRILTWVNYAPPELLDDLAMLATRMSTDVPTGGVEEEEDLWTVDRWLEHEKQRETSPRSIVYAAAEHLESGRLAGYTELSVPAETDRPVDQGDTIVVREHRGHRLGMLLKVANIQHLEEVFPGHPWILTYNAEENRYMLDVNEAVGFVPFTYEGAWQKRL